MALEKLLDISIDCIELVNMTQRERVAELGQQPPVLFIVIGFWLLFGLSIFLYGIFVQVGTSKKQLITLPNFFIFFIFWLVWGFGMIYLLTSGVWILPFI